MSLKCVFYLAGVPSTNLHEYADGLYLVEIDFETMFDEICLDPRLEPAKFQQLKGQLTTRTGLSIIQSDLYQFDLKPINLDI
jgi:hypothetical protein